MDSIEFIEKIPLCEFAYRILGVRTSRTKKARLNGVLLFAVDLLFEFPRSVLDFARTLLR